jgi:hypothetical protein
VAAVEVAANSAAAEARRSEAKARGNGRTATARAAGMATFPVMSAGTAARRNIGPVSA